MPFNSFFYFRKFDSYIIGLNEGSTEVHLRLGIVGLAQVEHINTVENEKKDLGKCILQTSNKREDCYALGLVCIIYCNKRAVALARCLNWYHYVC